MISLETLFKELASEKNIKPGELQLPLRVMLVGGKFGPPVFQIAEILGTLDAKIELHRKKRRVLEELFKALLHKLMTGEIDVNDLDLSALQPTA